MEEVQGWCTAREKSQGRRRGLEGGPGREGWRRSREGVQLGRRAREGGGAWKEGQGGRDGGEGQGGWRTREEGQGDRSQDFLMVNER